MTDRRGTPVDHVAKVSVNLSAVSPRFKAELKECGLMLHVTANTLTLHADKIQGSTSDSRLSLRESPPM
jgi:hypothetical protein